MTIIKNYVDKIAEELDGAMDYAEKYIEYKAAGDSAMAGKYKDMAADELKHAMNMHEIAVKEIDAVKKVYTAPAEMQRKWDESHAEYVSKHAQIKQMLGL